MIEFEKYLTEQGFKVFSYRFIGGNQVFNEGYCTPSTMGNLYNKYVRDNIEIIIGLNEVGHPITLCSHRSKFPLSTILYEGVESATQLRDNDINRMLLSWSNEEILNTILK